MASTKTYSLTSQGQGNTKLKGKMPIDVIIFLVLTIVVFVYLLVYLYWAEMQIVWTYTKNLAIQATTTVTRALINRRLLFSPVLTTSKIYPPHYHLNKKTDREKICFKNCYQTLTYLKPVSHIQLKDAIEPFLAPEKLALRDSWSLDLALRLRLDDIHYFAIRNVSISLMQHIFWWLEKQVQISHGSAKKKKQDLLGEKIHETFAALCQTGNKILEKMEQKVSFSGGLPSFFRQMFPAEYIMSPGFHVQSQYPVQGDIQGLEPHFEVSATEQLVRVQILLNWMMWKYSPFSNEVKENDLQHYGECGKKMYQDIREVYQQSLLEFFTACNNFERENITLMIDYLFFG